MRNKTMEETINAIKFLDIPTTKLARIAGIEPARVSEYVRRKSLPADKAEKIESAVRNIAKVWTIIPVRVDLNDLEGFARAVLIADEIVRGEANIRMAAETDKLASAIGVAFEQFS